MRAGQRKLPGTFRESYFREFGYRPENDGVVNAAVAVMVGLSWVVFALRRRCFAGNLLELYRRLHTRHGGGSLGRAYESVAPGRDWRGDIDASGCHPGTRPSAWRAAGESVAAVAAGTSGNPLPAPGRDEPRLNDRAAQ